MARKKKKKTAEDISENQLIVAVYGIGVDYAGNQYTYLEADSSPEDAHESLLHEIMDNIIQPASVFPDSKIDLQKDSPYFWSVTTLIPKNSMLGIPQDVEGAVGYWILPHIMKDKDLLQPKDISATFISGDRLTGEFFDRLGEIQKQGTFDCTLVRVDEENSFAYLVTFCDTDEDLQHFIKFLKEDIGLTDQQIAENYNFGVMPDSADSSTAAG